MRRERDGSDLKEQNVVSLIAKDKLDKGLESHGHIVNQPGEVVQNGKVGRDTIREQEVTELIPTRVSSVKTQATILQEKVIQVVLEGLLKGFIGEVFVVSSGFGISGGVETLLAIMRDPMLNNLKFIFCERVTALSHHL